MGAEQAGRQAGKRHRAALQGAASAPAPGNANGAARRAAGGAAAAAIILPAAPRALPSTCPASARRVSRMHALLARRGSGQPSPRTVRSMRAHVTPASSSSTSFSTVWHAGPTVMRTAGRWHPRGRVGTARRAEAAAGNAGRPGEAGGGSGAPPRGALPRLSALHCCLPFVGRLQQAGAREERRAVAKPQPRATHSWSWPPPSPLAAPSGPG